MIKKLLIIIIILLTPALCFSATQQVLTFGNNDNAANGAVEYNMPSGGSSYTPTEANTIVMWPSSGTIDDLRVTVALDPNVAGGTQSFAYMVRLDQDCNGTGANTTLTCTISETATSCNNSDGFSIAAGECVSIQ